jgi:predicted transcriptional regulator of viral defense system
MSGQERHRLADRIDELQAGGRYTVTWSELFAAAGGSPQALRSALRRLKAKGRLVSPRRGFFVLVPVEYLSTGAPPASWFVDDLMRYLGRPYYVGLLSAAALHGAAHHHPLVFQVATDVPTRPMRVGRVRLEFFRRRGIALAATLRVQTETGTMVVATPETTIFDLLRHVHSAGHLDNVATVFAELAEAVRPEPLQRAAGGASVAEVQRAGYLLELTGQEELARALEHHLKERRVRRALLRPDRTADGMPRSARWNLVLNERVEPDL